MEGGTTAPSISLSAGVQTPTTVILMAYPINKKKSHEKNKSVHAKFLSAAWEML